MLPDFAELLSLAAAARSSALPLVRVAQGSLLGTHRSAHRGRGLEFQEVRPYIAGDDVRAIDWRVTARRGRPHTKLFREERERPLWLVADLNPGMFFGSRRQTKSAVVVRACAFLAWVAFQMGDRVGAVIAGGGGPQIIPPRTQQRAVAELLGALLQRQPTAPGVPAPDSLLQALRSLARLVRPGSAIMAISDFAGLDSECEALWSGMGAHSESRLLWVTDELEEQGLPSGRYAVGLPGTPGLSDGLQFSGRSMILDGDQIRAVWQRAWQDRKARITQLAQRLGSPFIQLRTRDAVAEALYASLQDWRFAA
jgi:uncharacterized protein (DUF58 family)